MGRSRRQENRQTDRGGKAFGLFDLWLWLADLFGLFVVAGSEILVLLGVLDGLCIFGSKKWAAPIPRPTDFSVPFGE